MDASKKQLGFLIGLAKKAGANYEMDDFINEHGKIMISSKEASEMINSFKESVYGPQPDDPCQEMRRKIISMAHQIGWQLPAYGKPKVNMEKLEGWCLKYGQFHKPLNDHNETELAKLVTQFQYGPYSSKMKKH